MQQLELFTVAIILWGGILVFLFYLFIKMMRIQTTVERLVQQDEE